MKNKLKILFLIATLFLFVNRVNAATCELADPRGFCLDMTKHEKINGNDEKYFGEDAEKVPGNTYFKVSEKNEILYCSNVLLSTAHLTDDLEPIDQKCEEDPSLEKSIIYLYEYGYGENKETGKYAYNSKYLYGDAYKDYYITQSSVWYFYPPDDDEEDAWLLDQEQSGTNWNKFWFKAGYDFTAGTYYGKTYDMVTKMSALINDAKNAVDAVPSLEITSSSTSMNVTSDGKYYISDAITLTGKYLTEVITLNVTGVNGAFVTTDKNSTSGITTLSDGTNPSIEQTLYIKVPVVNVTTEEVALNLNVSSQSAFTDDASIIECTPKKGDLEQSMIKYDPILTNLSSDLTLTAKKYSIVISKSDDEGVFLPGATLVIKKDDEVIETWITTEEEKTILLAPGVYTLSETKAPDGYILNKEIITFTIPEEDEDQEEINMINEPIIITISKRSVKEENELPGATLRITDANGELAKDIDGNDLEWITSDEPKSFHIAAGTYILEEIQAPEGYELSDKKIEFTVYEDGSVTIEEGLIIKKEKIIEDNLIVFENTPVAENKDTGSLIIYVAETLCLLSLGVAIFFIVKRKEI